MLLIQSQVVVGRVGNSVAAFALQRLGAEVWQVPTVLLSNHPGLGPPRGAALPAGSVRAMAEGLRDLGLLRQCRAVLTGYLGQNETGEAALDAVAMARAGNPGLVCLCDPVLGDERTGLYVPAAVAGLIRDRAVPQADIVTPNLFELGWLTGIPIHTLDGVMAAVAALQKRGPNIVVVTSVRSSDPSRIGVILGEGDDLWRIETPRLSHEVNGAGDLLAALLLWWRTRGLSAPEALARAVSATFAVVRVTAERRAPHLLVMEAQDDLVAPREVFAPESI